MEIKHNFKMMVDDDLCFSIFNLNVNEEKKAKECFGIIYGAKKLNELKKFIKLKGIMSIFYEEVTDELLMFALIITQIQNQRKNK